MNLLRVYLVVIFAVLVCFHVSSQGGVVRHDVDPAAYVSLGAYAPYAAVGQISFTDGSSNYIASGTLISPDWVLTAAHVTADATSLDFTIGDQTISASKLVTHSKWRGDLLGGYDIGLVQLSSSVTSVAAATIYTGTDEFSSTAVSVGYGMTGTGLTGATIYDGLKRAGENTIDAFYRSHPRKSPTIFLSDFDNPDNPADNAYGNSMPLAMEYLIAPGDSGGGVFIDPAGDDSGPLLAGINSFVASFDGATDCDYGDVSGHIRVSAFADWISKTINKGGKKGNGKGNNGNGGQKSFYDLSISETLDPANIVLPEPMSITLLSLGGVFVIRRRRR